MTDAELLFIRQNTVARFAQLMYMVMDSKIFRDITNSVDERFTKIPIPNLIKNPFALTSEPEEPCNLKMSFLEQLRVRSTYMDSFLDMCKKCTNDLQIAYNAMFCMNWCAIRGQNTEDSQERSIYFSTCAREMLLTACDRIIWTTVSPKDCYHDESMRQLNGALSFTRDVIMIELQEEIVNPLYFNGTFKDRESIDLLSTYDYFENQ